MHSHIPSPHPLLKPAGKISFRNIKRAVGELGETLSDQEIMVRSQRRTAWGKHGNCQDESFDDVAGCLHQEMIDYIDEDADGEGSMQEFLEELLKGVK